VINRLRTAFDALSPAKNASSPTMKSTPSNSCVLPVRWCCCPMANRLAKSLTTA